MMSLFLFCDTNAPADNRQITPAAGMLINRQWVMIDYGFDENLNGKLDPTESRIEDCEKDDTYEFFRDGTGLAKSNNFSCCNGLDEQPFRWRLTDNGNSLQLFAETLSITRLTTRELITYKTPWYIKGQKIGLITIYRNQAL
jgi:hypothetical protein